MKKIILFSLVALGIGLSSCDMNKEPIGVINEENAIESVYDLQRFRNQAYNCMRSISGGTTWTLLDLQADEFYGTVNNGNRNMDINGGEILPNNGSTGSVFAGAYGEIANCNYFLNNVYKVLDRTDISEDDRAAISRYIGEVRFIRGFIYYVLMDRFCNSPENVNVNDPATGLQIVTTFNPSQDRASYPGRSTLAQTIKFIHDDINAADTLLNAWFADPKGFELGDAEGAQFDQLLAPEACYINPMTIKALQARLALIEGRNQDCVRLSKEIIKDGPYKLANGNNSKTFNKKNEIYNLWTYDTSNEIIFMPFCTNQEGLMSWGGLWIGSSPKDCDYMPTPFVAQNLYTTADFRKAVFIGNRTIDFSGTKVKVPAFVKFPGNPDLRTKEDQNNLANKSKVFRLSEVYLNLAEAAYLAGDEGTARTALIDLRKTRFNMYKDGTDKALTGDALYEQIKLERQRELIGEGFRISDLRRWHQGFDRTDTGYSNPQVKDVIRGASLISYPANYYRFVWPLPSEEFVNNPQVKGQQNPGY